VQTRAQKITEAIASKDRNNLYVTSSFFRDPLKYRAFCAYYAVMRVVDDRVDQLPAADRWSTGVRARELAVVDAWEGLVESCCRGQIPAAAALAACDFSEAGALCESFVESYRVYPVPVDLWTHFFSAMRSDLEARAFARWVDFLDYSEGATVAPTTIYLSLIVARRDDARNTCAFPPDFDLFACGRHLGIFAYLGHIVRDLAEDLTGTSTRLCMAREDLLAHGLSPEMLRDEALNRRASPAPRSLVETLLQRARGHLDRGRALTAPTRGFLASDCQFILELIIAMYERILAKIESAGYDPMAQQHRLSRLEKADVVRQVAARTGFSRSKVPAP